MNSKMPRSLLFVATIHIAAACSFAQAVELQPQPLFSSGENGYGRYRIPALIVTKKGTLLALCEGRRRAAGLTGDIDFVLRRSSDGGKSWQPQVTIHDDSTNTLGNPCPVIDESTGTIWLLMTRSPGEATEAQIVASESKGSTLVWVSHSKDDGVTWSKPTDITTAVKKPNWTWYGTGPGIGIQLTSGRLLVPSYHAVAGNKIYRSHAIYSDDGGKSWQLGEPLGDNTSEPQAAERRDGTVVINARSIKEQGYRTVATSRDGGRTWSQPILDRTLSDPSCQGSLLRYDRGEESSVWLFSNPPGPGRKRLTVRLSDDAGRSWRASRILDPGATEYSSLIRLPDGDVGCLYERNVTAVYQPQVAFVRFPLSWITSER